MGSVEYKLLVDEMISNGGKEGEGWTVSFPASFPWPELGCGFFAEPSRKFQNVGERVPMLPSFSDLLCNIPHMILNS